MASEAVQADCDVIVVTVNGWIVEVSQREAHDLVCWPPHGPERPNLPAVSAQPDGESE